MKEIVFSPDAVPPLTTFSQAIKSKGFIYVSGNIGCTQDFTIVEGGVGAQTVVALESIRNILQAAGSGLHHVVKANIYLTDLERDFSQMNSAYMTFFNERAMPARTCVGVARLPLGASVEIECVAELPDA
ncbi:Endoribonuclease L-PSP [Suillus bovinus]|uniref:Endoribonuclease L-PSP n=1 Tax=Suillus bovinus TaxID=48563 RepID=UPI001B86800C|nr:Endoribonuclease L-PSP [Suillus bovinus]KAG2136113.1 Endoribonuclease L-PSP [Suillus bovinus]